MRIRVTVSFNKECIFGENFEFSKCYFFRKLEDQIRQQKEEREERYRDAVAKNELVACQLCSDEPEFIPEETVTCLSGHRFCQYCVKGQSMNAMHAQQSTVNCLLDPQCEQLFSALEIKKCLPSRAYFNWILKVTANEITKAKLEGVESCPYCPYMVQMEQSNLENKVFICKNPLCQIKSCRLCKVIL